MCIRDRALDDVPAKISQYDLNALEAAKKLSAETKGSVTALSVGSSKALDATKTVSYTHLDVYKRQQHS